MDRKCSGLSRNPGSLSPEPGLFNTELFCHHVLNDYKRLQVACYRSWPVIEVSMEDSFTPTHMCTAEHDDRLFKTAVKKLELVFPF